MCNFEAGKLSVGRLVLLKEGFIRNVERKPVLEEERGVICHRLEYSKKESCTLIRKLFSKIVLLVYSWLPTIFPTNRDMRHPSKAFCYPCN